MPISQKLNRQWVMKLQLFHVTDIRVTKLHNKIRICAVAARKKNPTLFPLTHGIT